MGFRVIRKERSLVRRGRFFISFFVIGALWGVGGGFSGIFAAMYVCLWRGSHVASRAL